MPQSFQNQMRQAECNIETRITEMRDFQIEDHDVGAVDEQILGAEIPVNERGTRSSQIGHGSIYIGTERRIRFCYSLEERLDAQLFEIDPITECLGKVQSLGRSGMQET